MKSKKKEAKIEEAEEKGQSRASISQIAKKFLFAVILWGVAVIIVLSLFDQAGTVGKYFAIFLQEVLGWGRFVVPLILVLSGYWIVRQEKMKHPYYQLTGLFIIFISALAISSLIAGGNEESIKFQEAKLAGGYTGLSLAYLSRMLGFLGGLALLFTFFVVGLVLFLDELFSRLEEKKGKEETAETEGTSPEKTEVASVLAEKTEQSPEKEEPVVPQKENILLKVLNWRRKPAEESSFSQKKKKDKKISKGIFFGKNKEKEADAKQVEEKKIPSSQERNVLAEAKIINPRENWNFPPFNILEKTKSKAVAEDIKTNSAAIKSTLNNFGIPVEIADVNIGPTVTQYAIRPAEGIKLSRITSLQNDLAMSLAAHPIRIEAPIPGRSLVGIEVPNKVKRIVTLRDLLETSAFNESKDKLLIALGEDTAGNYVYGDLAEMPHLLIAGATGSGKSIGINCLVASLLYRNSPQELRMIMVDPKRVELSIYNDIPHLLTPVILEPPKVVNALKWAISEMERRYILIQETMSRNIVSYNDKVLQGEIEPEINQETGEIIEPEFLPYIVIVVDELADLMSSSFSKEIEATIVRLAQMSRAVGIHLVLSTQRPSVNVITGIIKANFPTRMAFQVVSQVDSRTILDMSGAEKLLGKGDMLYLARESNQPRRIQGAYVSEKELKKMVGFLTNQETAVYDPSVVKTTSSSDFGEGENGEEEDELYNEAQRIVTKEKRASTSLLQRHLRIGYARAARLMDLLEKNGVVGPAEGSKPRQVLAPAPSESPDYEEPLADQVKRDNWGL